jgi:hypothetical protein
VSNATGVFQIIKNNKKPEIFNFMVASLLMLGFVE